MALISKRSVKDINLRVTLALAAAGATATSSSLDLATSTAFRVPGVELSVEVPATLALADGKNITFTIQHSPDNGTTPFVAVPNAGPFTITGAGGNGAAATVFQTKLPLGLARYVRVIAVTDAAGGNSTGVSFSFGCVF